MKTLYDKEGNTHTFIHPVDAREAIQRNILFVFPPGKGPEPKQSESMGFNAMTKTEIATWAREEHGAKFNMNHKHELLVEQATELADRKKVKEEDEFEEEEEDEFEED